MQPLQLELRGLSTLHLTPLNLSLSGGEIITLSGPSGAGKSLLLRAICDLVEHQGELLLNGVSYQQFPAHQWRRMVGMLPAESYWWHERMAEHFAGAIDSELSTLGLSPKLLAQDVSQCSTGERQRLALLRLLQNRPQVLLLDEPTSGLDQDAALKVETMIRGYVTEQQALVIWVSHDSAQCRRIGNRHLQIESGHVSEVIL